MEPVENPGREEEELRDEKSPGSEQPEHVAQRMSEEPASDEPRKNTKVKKKKDGGLGTTRGIETMFRTSYRVHMNLSSLADAKANIMISINGLIISIIIAALSSKIDSNPRLLLPTTIMLLGSLISILYAVRSARPRVSSQFVTLEDVGRNRANILFFGHFTNMSEDDFVIGMSNLLTDQTTLYQNMIRDIYGLGQVLSRKFQLLRISYTVFMFGLTIGILAFIFVYVWIVIDPPDDIANLILRGRETLMNHVEFFA